MNYTLSGESASFVAEREKYLLQVRLERAYADAILHESVANTRRFREPRGRVPMASF